jgi:hypothetical protein
MKQKLRQKHGGIFLGKGWKAADKRLEFDYLVNAEAECIIEEKENYWTDERRSVKSWAQSVPSSIDTIIDEDFDVITPVIILGTAGIVWCFERDEDFQFLHFFHQRQGDLTCLCN